MESSIKFRNNTNVDAIRKMFPDYIKCDACKYHISDCNCLPYSAIKKDNAKSQYFYKPLKHIIQHLKTESDIDGEIQIINQELRDFRNNADESLSKLQNLVNNLNNWINLVCLRIANVEIEKHDLIDCLYELKQNIEFKGDDILMNYNFLYNWDLISLLKLDLDPKVQTNISIFKNT